MHDEIPGYTGYLYNEHRYREPHEYVNYWKVEDKIWSEISQLAGQKINDIFSVHSVLIALDQKIQDLKSSLEEASKIINDQERIIDLNKSALQDHNKQISALSKQIKNAFNMLKEYGYHKEHCNFTEAASTGRTFGKRVKNICTCGWHEFIEECANTDLSSLTKEKDL